MTKRTARSYSAAFRQSVVEKIKSGERVSVVADKSGVHYSLVYAWLKKAGIAPPKKGGMKIITEKFKLKDSEKMDRVRDALIYLRHARREILEKSSVSSLSRANLLTLLALDAMEGR